MKTFELKSAKEVLELVNTDKAKRLDAMSYAIEKRDLLKSKGKNRRARLWDNLISKLQSLPETKEPVKKTTPQKYKSETKNHKDLKKVKIAGVTQYVPKDLTANGLGMLRQTANAVSRHSLKIVRAQEKAYRLWKQGSNAKHSIQL